MPMRVRRATPLLAVACAVALAAGPKKPKKPADAPSDAPTKGTLDLPSNPALASLRVAAMETLYELDATPQQIRALRTAATAAGTADRPKRPAGKGSDKLTAAMRTLAAALADGGDDSAVATARNAMVDAAADLDPPLDDDVHPTPGARAQAAAVLREFTASQLAAYLAAHADQVPDPAEAMMAALPDVAQDDTAADRIAAEVAQLVAGGDETRAAPLANKVAAWERSNRAAGVPDSAAGKARLEASARQVVGDVSPVEVLDHWLEQEMATLVSNPQFSEAASVMIAARSKEQ